MSDDLYDLNGLAASLQAALEEELAAGGATEVAAPAVELSLPARPEHGDVTTNAALITAKRAGRVPRELAEAVGARWLAGPGAGVCDRFEVAGPGFLNLFLNDAWYRGALDRLLQQGADYGRGSLPVASRQKMNVEFVSVNPTGPLHVGHARYASYGDALCRILAFVGHDVTREFYVNDYGTQMTRFGQSLAARYGQRMGLDTPVPEEGYQGDYLLPLADELIAVVGDRFKEALEAAAPDVTALPAETIDEIKVWGRDAILAQFRLTLERLRVPFDVWTPESSLYAGEGDHRGFGGEVGKSLADLDGESLLYDEGGACWLTHDPLRRRQGPGARARQTGDPTYFAQRHRLPPRQDGPRLRAHDRHLGRRPPRLRAAHEGRLHRAAAARPRQAGAHHRPAREPAGERRGAAHEQAPRGHRHHRRPARRHRRGRRAVPARRALAGHHPGPRHRPRRAAEQHNPVYYVQYAHARICSILRNLPGGGERPAGEAVPAVDVTSHERALLQALARFPDVLLSAADTRSPHRVHGYLGELASEFHVFYRHCRVLSDDADVTAFRAGLCTAVRSTLAAGLGLLGVSAPETM